MARREEGNCNITNSREQRKAPEHSAHSLERVLKSEQSQTLRHVLNEGIRRYHRSHIANRSTLVIRILQYIMPVVYLPSTQALYSRSKTTPSRFTVHLIRPQMQTRSFPIFCTAGPGPAVLPSGIPLWDGHQAWTRLLHEILA